MRHLIHRIYCSNGEHSDYGFLTDDEFNRSTFHTGVISKTEYPEITFDSIKHLRMEGDYDYILLIKAVKNGANPMSIKKIEKIAPEKWCNNNTTYRHEIIL